MQQIIAVGAPEIGLILLVVLVLFGGSQIPKLARNFGTAKKEFEQGMKQGYSGVDSPSDPPPPTA